MAKKELKIGETFQFGTMTLRCVKATDECSGCIFDMPDKCDKHHMAIGACLGDSRTDKTSVIFVKVDDDELQTIHDVKAGTVDWEQRRYEIAKECVAVLMRNKITLHDAAKISVEQADELIAELQKGGLHE